MSPLWRDEIGVLISPRRVLLNRMSRGLRPQCKADACLQVDEAGFADWTPALVALRGCLAEPTWRNANVRVVISDQWVRYAIVPWVAELRDDTERLAHARHVLTQIYGDGVADWTIALSEPAPGRTQVASAMPTLLLEELSNLVQRSGSRLLSIEPQLLVAFNVWRTRLPEGGGWFVSIDNGSLAAAHMTPRGWDRVHSVRIGSNWSAELHRLRVFGRLVSGPAEQRVFVEAPMWLRMAAGDGEDGLEWLDEMTSPAATLGRLVELKRLHA